MDKDCAITSRDGRTFARAIIDASEHGVE